MIPYSYAQRIQHARGASVRGSREILDEALGRLGATEREAVVADIGRVFLRAWLDSGFQLIRVGSRLAALYAATTISTEALSEFRWPWRAFVVETDELRVELNSFDDGDVTVEVESIFCPLTITWFGPPAKMLTGTFVGDEGDGDPDLCGRIFAVALRMVLGCCLALTDPETREVAGRRGRRLRNQRPAEKFLPGTQYVLGNNVKVDLTSHVREYVERGGSSPKVRTIVCGHHKWQPHGPQLSLRKHIWIQPYLRGPEDAPMIVRVHTIDGAVTRDFEDADPAGAGDR